MTSSDIIAIASYAAQTEDDEYILVWGNLEVLDSFNTEDQETAKKFQESYNRRTGLSTKLYQKVKE